jgi:arylsulfatase A-like enzyme
LFSALLLQTLVNLVSNKLLESLWMNVASRLVLSAIASLTLITVGCTRPVPPSPTAQRLVDDFSPSLVSRPKAMRASARELASRPPFVWRFDEPNSAEEWQAAAGVGDLTVRGGLLVGQSTTTVPILRLSAIQGVDPGDMLYEVQVRMRVSAGQKLGVHFVAATPNDLDKYILTGTPMPWPNEAPITSGEGMTTFTLRPQFPVLGSGLHDLLIRPTDAEGARFEIESVRIVFRREHLASIPSGVGWLGMGEIYRETVVARSPETIRWPMTLPDRPRLSLSLATLDERPVTFHVAVHPAEGETVTILERTVTTPHRWEDAAMDLDEWRGRKVTLSLSLDAASPGTLGVWAAPAVVRRRSPQVSQTAADRPQAVILVMTDTLRADRLDAYGNKRQTAPTLARLAREGALFRDTHSQATWTKVSAPTLLTSLYPLTLGVRDFPDRVPSAAVTLAEAFRKGGYTTLGFTSAPFTGTFSNMHQGYEELYESPLTLPSSKTARPITDLLLPWLDEHRDEPFFAYVHYFDPHGPYRPDPPFDSLWGEPTWAAEHEQNGQKASAAIQDPERQIDNLVMPSEFKAAGVDLATFRNRELLWYDGSIREMDTELERLMERLRELGLDQRTLLVFTSDHGEEFFEHGFEGHGQSAYNELTHVPLIVRYPGVVPPGQKIDETVGLVDVMPTILSLSRLPIPEEAQGQSLAPLLKTSVSSGSWKPRPVFTDRPAAPHFASPAPRANETFTVIHEGWKLVWNTHRPAGAPEYELYDHRRDPGDRQNVAAQHPDVVQRLSRLIAGWKQDSLRRKLPPDEVAGRDLRPEERERLRALGYIH